MVNGKRTVKNGIMAQGRGAGGCVALAAVLIAVAIGVVLLGVIFFSKARVAHAVDVAELRMTELRMTEEYGGGDMVVFSHGRRPTLSLPEAGQPVTREQYVAYLNDDRATKLARESFREVADQSEVRWSLRTVDISSDNGQLRGEFEVPWQIRHDHGSTGGSLQMACEFVETSRKELLGLRRGDWVMVQGKLVFKGERARLIEARISSETAAPVAEDPGS